MASVQLSINPAAFNAGGPLEAFADQKSRAHFIIQQTLSSLPADLNVDVSKQGRIGRFPPNSASISLRGTTTSWFGSPDEFNKLPYEACRSIIANMIEKGLVKVLNSSGGTATPTEVRAGTVT